MIAEATIQQAKQNIFEVVSRYVTLKRSASGFVGLCPFHNEKTPSFNVNPSKGIYKCFGCGESGDAIKFIRKVENKTFEEAIDVISNIGNITVERAENRQQTAKKQHAKPIVKSLPLEDLPTSTCDVLNNPLTASMVELLGMESVINTLWKYKIGIDQISLHYPQLDTLNRYRTGKRIFVNESGGKSGHFKWSHTSGFSFTQCLTGLHLISKRKSVAIVEGHSTMLFMAALTDAIETYNITELSAFSNCTWLCTGGVGNINLESDDQMESLKGCEGVILYPDAGFYTNWQKYGEAMNKAGIKTVVSQFMEEYYNRQMVGYNEDLRDVFMKYLPNDLQQSIAGGIFNRLNSGGTIRIGNEFYEVKKSA